MKSAPRFIYGGGMQFKEVALKARANLFGMLSAVCFPVTTIASYPFWFTWPEVLGVWEILCVSLLAAQTALAAFAIYFWLFEKPRVTRVLRHTGHFEPSKLY